MVRPVFGVVIVAAALFGSSVRAEDVDAGAPAKRPSRAVAALVQICGKRNPKTRLLPSTRAAKIVVEGAATHARKNAVGAIAKKVGQPVERLELAALLGKYTAETEKNLAALFDRAERSDAVLFIDEADALLGAQSRVKDGHDRFVSSDLRLVLERVRAHRGLVLLGHVAPVDELTRAEVRSVFTLVRAEASGEELWASICA